MSSFKYAFIVALLAGVVSNAYNINKSSFHCCGVERSGVTYGLDEKCPWGEYCAYTDTFRLFSKCNDYLQYVCKTRDLAVGEGCKFDSDCPR
eukprot:Pgem_evm1s15473